MDAVFGPRTRTNRAAALHRRAEATAAAAAAILDEIRPAPADQRRQYELADRLRSTAALLAPGWAGASLETLTVAAPSGEGPPPFVRVGMAAPLDDARFPALVPLLGTGHLTIDSDARDPRVAGLLRAVLLRLLAGTPAGCLLVRVVDGTGAANISTTTVGTATGARTDTVPGAGPSTATAARTATTSGTGASPAATTDTSGTGTGRAAPPDGTFAPFAGLADAGLLPPPATDVAGLRAVLTEAEQWVSPGSGRPRRHDRTLLLVVAGWPEATGPADLDRVEALAARGRAAGLHLIVAGWPPAGPYATRAPLPQATPLAMRNAYALLGDPPGSSLAGPGAEPPGGLNSPVFVDDDPPSELVDAVCRRLATEIEAGSRLSLADLLPDPTAPLWAVGSAEGVSTTVGDAGGRPVTVGFTELTPHWLVSGRSGADRAAFLSNVLLGLSARYGPDELVLHLADLGDGESFAEFLQTERDRSWVPQVRSAGMAADREYVLDLLDELTAEARRREEAGQRAGGQRFAGLREHQALPRVVCVIDNLPLLLAERDRLATDAVARLDALARSGRAYGVHLVLAGEGDLGIAGGPTTRDSMLGQFPVRVALAGGGPVLEPSNDAAAGLPVGSAVVNTAGGLGGPRGATRGHERMVRFPDPHEAPETIGELRRRLWTARPERSAPPVVFAGWARPSLRNDPHYRAAFAGRARGPVALLGRAVDLSRSTVMVPLGAGAGRNLAVLGPGAEAVALLATAARSVAAHHPPGTGRFVVAALAAEAAPVADSLAADLAGQHRVERVDLPGLLAAVDAEEPGYLVVFGLDRVASQERPADGPAPQGRPTDRRAANERPANGPDTRDRPADPAAVHELLADRLRVLLRDGPPAGRHLLGWWRTVPPFTAMARAEDDLDKLAAVVAVDVPGAQLAALFGRPVQWRPRPGRAMLWDGPDERGVLLVPFAGPGGDAPPSTGPPTEADTTPGGGTATRADTPTGGGIATGGGTATGAAGATAGTDDGEGE
ncbi:cell division protein FtsK [Micromonospora haikouensis]|uniref:cell division protein FtsK n=1 Tax=Micromonospora haikouensis TaxID=686309 RepID=UPI00367D80DE